MVVEENQKPTKIIRARMQICTSIKNKQKTHKEREKKKAPLKPLPYFLPLFFFYIFLSFVIVKQKIVLQIREHLLHNNGKKMLLSYFECAIVLILNR